MLIIKYKDGLVFKNLNATLIKNAQFDRSLDKYGGMSFDYPLTEPESDLLTNRTEIQFWEDSVFITGGKISNTVVIPVSDELYKRVTVNDYLVEFSQEGYTVPNRIYINETVANVLDPLYPKTFIVPSVGWSVNVEPTLLDITCLTSLQTSISTFQILRDRIGYHFRYAGTSLNPKTIDFGLFGNNSGIRLRKNPKSHFEVGSDILMIESLEITEDYDNIVNYLYVLGGGGDNGLNQTSLRDVDPLLVANLGYPILIDPVVSNDDVPYDPSVFANSKTGPNNVLAYYIQDPASQANYGVIKDSVVFKDVAPISNNNVFTDADRQNAANEIYKSAVQELINRKEENIFYRVSAIGTTNGLNVGDKISLKYKGETKKFIDGRQFDRVYIDVDVDLYIVSMNVSYMLETNNLKRYDFELSNKPIAEQSGQDIIGNTVQAVREFSRIRSGSVSTGFAHYQDSLDSTHPAEFLFRIPQEMIYTDRLELQVKVRRFRAYEQAIQGGGGVVATSAAGGGSVVTSNSNTAHRHAIFVRPNPFGDVNPTYPLGLFGPYPPSNGVCAATKWNLIINPLSGIVPSNPPADQIETDCTLDPHSHTVSIPAHTHNFTLPNHTHSILYGIFEDTNPFAGLTLFIDGVDYSSEVGVWNTIGYKPAINSVYDLMVAANNLGPAILDALLTPGSHTFEARCTSGLVMIEMFIYYQFYLSSR